MIHSITNNENADITIYFIFEENLQGKIIGPSIIIRPWKKDIVPYNIENCIELHLKDSLIIDSDGIWGPSDIFEWISALNSNLKIDLDKYPIRYWTPVKDIISLIETLIELPERDENPSYNLSFLFVVITIRHVIAVFWMKIPFWTI